MGSRKIDELFYMRQNFYVCFLDIGRMMVYWDRNWWPIIEKQ